MTESPSLAFPFLRLPREIRDCVYRQLLITRYNFTHPYNTWEAIPWPFKLTPAILRANKQVSSEASEVLYKENEFVVLRIATRRHTCLDNFPNFSKLSEAQIPRPVLNITVKDVDMVILDQGTKRTFIFTLEGFPYFIAQLWVKGRACDFYSSVSFVLFLHSRAPSRHAYLNNHIVRTLDQIQGFPEVRINGDVDDEVVQHLTEYMALGPHLHDVVSRLTGLFSQGEHYFKQKEYEAARWYWDQQSSFWMFRHRLHRRVLAVLEVTPPQTQYPVKDFLEATMAIMLKVELRKQMMDLHSKDYRHAADTAHRPLLIAQKLIDANALNYSVPPVLKAKFFLCQSVGQFALGEKENSAQSQKVALLALCQDRRFSGNFYQVSIEVGWARDRYLEQQEEPWKCREKDRSTLMLETQAILSGWRSFQDWMELPEADLGSSEAAPI